MITGRFAGTGKTRTCPHCRATILDSATVCPGCHHHLRFDSSGASPRVLPAATPLRVEGTVRHPANGGSWEYSVVLAIRNDRGEEIARQVVGVGALQPGDARTFSLAVEVFKPAELRESRSQAADAAERPSVDPKSPELRAPGRPGPPPAPAAQPSTPSTQHPQHAQSTLRPTPLADGKSRGVTPAHPGAPGAAAPQWPIPPSAAGTSAGTSGRYPAAPASAGTSGKYPSTAAPGAATSKAPPNAPAASAPGRTAPGQPPRPTQAPSLNGGSAAPGRGTAPGTQPKRP